MQQNTGNWDGNRHPGWTFDFKAVINGETYTYADIKSGTIKTAMMDKLSIGQTVSATLDMEFSPRGEIPNAARIDCYIRSVNNDPNIFVADETLAPIMTDDDYWLMSNYASSSDWLPFGTFYIDTREAAPSGLLSITAYDAMLRAELDYSDDTGTYPMQMEDAVRLICRGIGVELDERSEIAPYTIDSPTGLYTMREVLASIAAASAGNAYITKDNKLLIKRLASPQDAAETAIVSLDLLSDDVVTLGKVTLFPDDDTQYSSGTDGYEIQADCLYATQEVCDYVHDCLNGVQYRPYTATTAYIDPILEPGDSVNVNGNPTILGSMQYTISQSMTANIDANIDTEVNHEYPYQSRTKEERKTASSISQIKKSTEQIALDVEGKVDEEDVSSVVDVNLNKISLNYSAGTNGATITLSKDGVEITGLVKIGEIDASEIVVTNLDADEITTGELSANRIKLGGDMEVYETLEGDIVGGYLGYTTGTYGGAGIHMQSGNGEIVATTDGAKLCYGSNTLSVSSNGVFTNCAFNPGGSMAVSGSVAPATDNKYTLGYSGYRWLAIWAKTSTISTSDRRAKEDISYDLSKYDALFDRLKPASYKLKDGESGRTHTGLIAQDVEAALEETGLSGQDLAAFVKPTAPDGAEYGLRYEEFIALCIRQIQRLTERVDALEREITEAKNG